MNTADLHVVPIPGSGLDITCRPLESEPYHPVYNHTSMLFRGANYLEELVGLALDGYHSGPADNQFKVLSVGCSFGLEVDSVLAHITDKTDGELRAKVHGVDVNPWIIDAARRGKVMANLYDDRLENPSLRHFGLAPVQIDKTEFDQRTYDHLVDSRSLRSKHQVGFDVVDLAEPGAESPLGNPDLLLCNFVLMHLKEEKIAGLIDAMIRAVKPGGYVSIGALPAHPAKQEFINERFAATEMQPVWYSEWLVNHFPFVYQKPMG